jgi:16S rRNA (guanine966-N2)-methyltransferase
MTELENRHFLADIAYIYLEAESSLKTLPLPRSWRLYRSKHSGQVSYHLAIREPLREKNL